MTIPYAPGDPLSCAEIREVDRLAIQRAGLPGVVLMENAGRAAAEFIYASMLDPMSTPVVVLAGPGNNGGDGFVVARHLLNARVRTTTVLTVDPDRVDGDAAVFLNVLRQMLAPCVVATANDGMQTARRRMAESSVIVDALLGTGTRGAPRGVIAELIEAANAAAATRIAIDVPSGLDADSGVAFEPCIRADATITFVAAKRGFFVNEGPAHVGRLTVVGIGSPDDWTPGRKNIGGGLDG